MEWVIDPLSGIGNIKFGDTAKSVKELCGSELCYEDWMGGNLEDSLFYKGLLIGFRGKHDDHPNDDSEVSIILIKASIYELILWQEIISNFSKKQLITLLSKKSIRFKELNNNTLQCTELDINFYFDHNLFLDKVSVASPQRKKHSLLQKLIQIDFNFLRW
ncbi:hypothetical protein QSV37_16875 [Acinetobacter sp. VNK23]|uniref:hypothetical protein n=1 Tax=Acinetobacter thutiue TaxID=2998078 RepID=UPI002578BEF5|nr:hypothetical protein [Acinetobacter thutiue]MDM1021950.1 hypothetical protein [Acinetobacter thutiue]